MFAFKKFALIFRGVT